MMPHRRTRSHDDGDDLRHHQAGRYRAGFTRLLRAQFTKFRTARGWMITLCAAGVVFVLVSAFSAFESRYAEPSVPTGPGGEAVSDTYMLVHQALASDGTLTARVTSLSGDYAAPSSTSGNTFRASSQGGPARRPVPRLQGFPGGRLRRVAVRLGSLFRLACSAPGPWRAGGRHLLAGSRH
jgi:hypothetical protein